MKIHNNQTIWMILLLFYLLHSNNNNNINEIGLLQRGTTEKGNIGSRADKQIGKQVQLYIIHQRISTCI